jgi:cobalt-zinc-cadmium efflux system protein
VTRTQRLTTVLALNLGLVASLVAVGVGAHSLAVLAEGGDYLLDAAGIGVAIFAIWLSATPATDTRRRAHPNATTVAALVNAGWLLILELLVASGAIDRLITGTPHVAGLPVLIVSAVAAVVMLIGALVLRGDHANREPDDDDDLSTAAVLLDTVADAAAAAGVATAGAIILATGGWYWLDPAVALIIAIVIGWHAAALIRKVLKQLPSRSQRGQADLAPHAMPTKSHER